MTIKLITLKTNHTLMGNVELDDNSDYRIKEPVQVVMVPPRAANDTGSIAFSPFLDYAEEFKTGIKIKSEDVLTVNTPVTELQNQYNTVFGSGIQIAKTL